MLTAHFDERLLLITCEEEIVQPVGQSITLLAEWQWMGTSTGVTTNEVWTNQEQVQKKRLWRKVKKKVYQARRHETWMRWNGFFETRRVHPTEHVKHLAPRAHGENVRVCHVINARGAVCCSQGTRGLPNWPHLGGCTHELLRVCLDDSEYP